MWPHWSKPRIKRCVSPSRREVQEIRTVQVCQAYDQLTKTTAGLKVDYERLNEESRRDGLTQLFNRATLDEYLAQAFKYAVETRTLLSVCFLDLDNFKQVNDTYGHAIGDRILQATGEILKAQIRTTVIASIFSVHQCQRIYVYPHRRSSTNPAGIRFANRPRWCLARILRAKLLVGA